MRVGRVFRTVLSWTGAATLAFGCTENLEPLDGGPTDEDADAHAHQGDHVHEDVTCPDGSGLEDGTIVRSVSGHFYAELVSMRPAEPRKGENSWTVKLVNAQGTPLSDTRLVRVQPFMPEHGHDGRFAPELTELGSSESYLVSRINLWMGGMWEVRLFAEIDGVTDRAVFDVCVSN